MSPDLQLVSKVQGLDLRITELEKEIATLPKHVASIEKTLETHQRRLEADRAALAANQKDRKSLETDSKVQEEKISKLRGQMAGAKTNEQYSAFQNEINFCSREIRKFEDRILDLMSESELLDANVKKAEAALKEEKQHVDAEKKRAVERTANDKTQVEALRAERKDAVVQIAPPMYTAYERIRKKHGTAIAEASDGRCTACFIVLRPQFYQELRKGDQLMFCESCGRILFYNPAVKFEDAPLNHAGGKRLAM